MTLQGFLTICCCLVIACCGTITELNVWQDRAYGRPFNLSSTLSEVENVAKNGCLWTAVEESAQLTVDLGKDLPVYNVTIIEDTQVPLKICLKNPKHGNTSSCKIKYPSHGEQLHLEFQDFEATLLEVLVLQRARFSLCSVEIISPDGKVEGKPSQNHLWPNSDARTTVDDDTSCSTSFNNIDTFWNFHFIETRKVTDVNLKLGGKLRNVQKVEVSAISPNGSVSSCATNDLWSRLKVDCGGKRGQFIKVQRKEKGQLLICDIFVSTTPTRENTLGVFGWSFQAQDVSEGFEAWQPLLPGHGLCNTGCSLSGSDRDEAVWWKVILQKKFLILAVQLTGRSDLHGLNLFGSSIYVKSSHSSFQLCADRLFLPPGESRWFKCNPKQLGDEVCIYKPNDYHFLSLCEVTIRVEI